MYTNKQLSQFDKLNFFRKIISAREGRDQCLDQIEGGAGVLDDDWTSSGARHVAVGGTVGRQGGVQESCCLLQTVGTKIGLQRWSRISNLSTKSSRCLIWTLIILSARYTSHFTCHTHWHTFKQEFQHHFSRVFHGRIHSRIRQVVEGCAAKIQNRKCQWEEDKRKNFWSPNSHSRKRQKLPRCLFLWRSD